MRIPDAGDRSVAAILRRGSAWALRPFSRVEPAEIGLVAVMATTSFLLLTAYYLLKTVREPLILLEGGAEVKLYARAGQTLLMAVFVHFYGELARRVGAMKLLLAVFSFFISNLVVFALLARFTTVHIGLAFFVWVGIFSYTAVAQFWALAADVCSEEQGKRLFPIFGAGSSLGAVAGSALAKPLVPYGPPVLMGTAVLILIVCVCLILAAHRARTTAQARRKAEVKERPLSRKGAFALLIGDRYLLLIGGMVVLLNWVASSGEYLLDRTVLVAAEEAQRAEGTSQETFIGAFKADYFALYNLFGMLLQLFAVSRILRLVGVANALFFLPVSALVSYGAAALLPVLAVMRIVGIGQKSLQYSLQETTRHALFLVADRAEKFVGKTAIDTVAVRVGAISSATVTFIGTHLGWSLSTFAVVNVVLAAAWIAVVVAIAREHRARAEREPEKTPAPA